MGKPIFGWYVGGSTSIENLFHFPAGTTKVYSKCYSCLYWKMDQYFKTVIRNWGEGGTCESSVFTVMFVQGKTDQGNSNDGVFHTSNGIPSPPKRGNSKSVLWSHNFNLSILTFSVILSIMTVQCWSQWPRGLTLELFSPARTLGSWVRIPPKAWTFGVCMRLFCVRVVLCVGSGLAMDWSPVQGVLPTEKVAKSKGL
jgi:hypothetical protein